jgi:Structural protein gp24
MGFQSVVNLTQGFGVQGEIIYDGPMRSYPWNLVSSPEPNVIGATAYTVVTQGTAMAGGTGVFAGVLVSPKSYANFSSGLTATMTLADDTSGELLTMGTVLLNVGGVANIGDLLAFSQTTGALSVVPSSFAVTASFATNVMTVTGTPAAPLSSGSVVSFAGVAAGTTVTEVLTGTGAAGTYALSTIPGTVASATGSATPGKVAGTGLSFVPHGSVVVATVGSNGLAICELTN